LAATLTLTVSIAAAAATWSLLSAVLLRPLPVQEPETLQVLGRFIKREGNQSTILNGFVYPYLPLVRDSGVFERVAAQWANSVTVKSDGGVAEVSAVFASHDFFDVLGVRIPVGRSFTPDDDRRGAPAVAVLTDRYWRRAFAGNAAVIGQTLIVRDKAVTIVGIAQPGFRGLDLSRSVDLYLPFHTIADFGSPLNNYFADTGHPNSPSAGTSIIVRLRTDSRPSEVLARLAAVEPPATERAKPEFVLTDINTAAIPFAARPDMARFSQLLTMTVILLLLLGSSTVGMLMLLRIEARRVEFAVCLALGASRARLAKGVVMESALLGSLSAVASVPVAWWLFFSARSFRLPGNVSIEPLQLSVNAATVMGAAVSALLAVIVIALLGGLYGYTTDIADGLRSRAVAARDLRRHIRSVLVAGQVAVTLTLLTGAGLLARSMMTALTLNPGLDATHLLTGRVWANAPNPERAAVFFDELGARLRANPAIQSVAFSTWQGGMTSAGTVTINGSPRRFPSMVSFTVVEPGYFRTMRIPLVSGRDFSNDDRKEGPLVALVSQSLGRMLADGGNPIGARIESVFRRVGQSRPVMEVVGVIGDVITDVTAAQPLDIYLPVAQAGPDMRTDIAVRPAGDPAIAQREVLSTIRQIDPMVIPPVLQTLNERIAEQMAPQRFGASIMGALGGVAILLTLLGIYVIAESMAVVRAREMGIRAALGARATHLAGIVLKETVRLVGVGLAVGLLLVWAGSNTIRVFLFRVQPLDAITLATMVALILFLATAVSLRPAVRAARVDVCRVLKER
jgi:predicted permease